MQSADIADDRSLERREILRRTIRAAADGVTYTCGLTGLNRYQGLLVWNTAGNGSYTPPGSGPLSANYTQKRDLAGNV